MHHTVNFLVHAKEGVSATFAIVDRMLTQCVTQGTIRDKCETVDSTQT